MLYLCWPRFEKFSNLLQVHDDICYLHSCHPGYSVRSWSKPPRGTAPLLSEERRQALMSRLWGHSEYSDLWDWCLECPVSTWTGDMREKEKRKKRKRKKRQGALRIRCKWWLSELGEKWTRGWSWYCCLMPHVRTQRSNNWTRAHTHWHTRSRWVIYKPFCDGGCKKKMINPQTRGERNGQSVCISGSYRFHRARAHPTRVLQATVTWPCLFIELVSWQPTSNVFTADELRVLSNKHGFYCVFRHVWVLSAVSLCPSCRFTGSAELHNQSHGSSAPHRPAGPLRHHYLRHHRPGALHGQDA